MGVTLSRDQILDADDLQRKEVTVKEWGGSVFVRSMTGSERDAWEQSIIAGAERNLDNIRARLVVLTAVDAEGRRIFENDDADALGKKSAKALDRLFAAASRLNGLGRADIEELAGNS